MTPTRLLVLLVEDDGKVAASLVRIFSALEHYVVACVSTGPAAIQAVTQYRPHIIFMDLVLEGSMDGVVTSAIIRQYFDIPIVYLTGSLDDEVLARAKRGGPHAIVAKPFTQDDIENALNAAIGTHAQGAAARPLHEYRGLLVARRAFLLATLKDMQIELDQINAALGGSSR